MNKTMNANEIAHLYDHHDTSGYEMQEINETYYALDRFTNAMLWEPKELDDRARICVVSMHGGYGRGLRSEILQEFAKRGFRSMWVVPAQSDYPSQMLDFKLAIEFLRGLPGLDKIVLMGSSRGASLMSAYQRVAENGVKVFQGPNRRYQFPEIGPLPPADGLMLLDANYGFMHFLGTNPALVKEFCATEFNPELDCLNPANGYDPKGAHYSEEFCRKFWDAQRTRLNNLMDYAQERLALIEAGKGNYYDDEPFYVPEMHGMIMSSGKLFCMDTHFFSHTRGEHPLIHPDGSITREVVRSVRIPKCDPRSRGMLGASALPMTVRSFLQWEMNWDEGWGYDEDHFWGVDFTSCMTSPNGNVTQVTVPSLFMGMTGSHEYIAAEWCYNDSVAKDKTIAFVEGASHGLRTAKETEVYPGQWGDCTATLANYVAAWLTEKGRFL